MKKLNKLNINSEKIINGEELITLRGGYGSGCTCSCIPGGYLVSPYRDCGHDCYEAFGSSGSCVN